MPTWLIPTVYAAGALLASFILPRLEHAYLRSYLNEIGAASALAYLSAIASGMLALTAIVFSIAYLSVQFNAVAYSPRLALWYANDPRLFHALGMFMATFLYALGTIAWVDRSDTGGVPLLSAWIVLGMLIASMLHFSRLVRGLSDLQITNTLRLIGDKGRAAIKDTFPRPDSGGGLQDGRRNVDEPLQLGLPAQTMRYSGVPRIIASLDMASLVRTAERHGAVIEIACAVGDTLLDGSVLVNVYGGSMPVIEAELLGSIRLGNQRTFEQDPKYPIRLLVDIAIKALSPAINDPTTAVQAIDEIEDLLRRLGRRDLDGGVVRDGKGVLRVVFPMPNWEDYLRLAFDEIRQYGSGSVQVMRRLRAAMSGIAEAVAGESRATAVQHYLKQLDLIIDRSALDPEDRAVASQEDRQGLGLSRKQHAARPSSERATVARQLTPLP